MRTNKTGDDCYVYDDDDYHFKDFYDFVVEDENREDEDQEKDICPNDSRPHR